MVRPGRTVAIRNHLPAVEICGCEVGVGHGNNATHLLKLCPQIQQMHLVDVWAEHATSTPEAMAADYARTQDLAATRSQQWWDELYASLPTVFGDDWQRCIPHRMASHHAAEVVADRSLDFVFIDANHSYDGVSNDYRLWLPKLKAAPHAWIGGHDYAHPKDSRGLYGVTKFVRTLQPDMLVLFGQDHTWFAYPQFPAPI